MILPTLKFSILTITSTNKNNQLVNKFPYKKMQILKKSRIKINLNLLIVKLKKKTEIWH
jgi:hypothetical protein